jgi:hypothetical protein
MNYPIYVHDRAQRLAGLPTACADALVAVCSATATTDPSVQARAAVRELLDRLHSDRHWLECGCPADVPPLLFPRRREGGRLELVRHHGTPHAAACPLRQLRSTAATVGNPQQWFRVGAGEGGSDSVLVRVAEIWELAGLDRVAPESLAWLPSRDKGWRPRHIDVPGQYRQLHAADALRLDPHVELGDVCAHHPMAIARTLAGVAKLGWSRGVARQGFFLGVVDAVDRAHRLGFSTSDTPLRLPAAPQVRGEGGPFAALVAFRDGPDGRLHPATAGLMSLFSRGLLLPVASSAERSLALVLLAQIRYWAEKRDTRVVLRKPLAVDTASFSLDLPDGGCVLVDLVPSPGPASRVAHARMKDAPGVRALFGFTPGVDAPDALRRQLTAAVLR